MTRRAVLSLDVHGPNEQLLRIEERIVDPQPDEARHQILALDAIGSMPNANPPAPGAVARSGEALFALLSAFEPAARQLAAARQSGHSLLIEDLAPESQGLPWEALCIPNGSFIGLGDAPFLGRVVTPFGPLQTLQGTWDGTLRILAVLAASGAQRDGRLLTGVPELRALVAGLTTPGAPPFDLTVVSGDVDLGGPEEDDVAKAVQALGDERIRFHLLKSLDTLEDLLDQVQPQILHLFCHGFAGKDVPPQLEFALRDDQIGHEPRGSLIIEASTAARLVKNRSKLWLLVLNCCLGAKATESVSFARQVMAEPNQTLPGLIAMREAVDRRDAHLFSQAFYRRAGALIGDTTASAPKELQWIEALPSVRERICKARVKRLSRAGESHEWTLPVVYVRRETFQIAGMAAPPNGAEDPAAVADESQEERINRIETEIAFLRSLRGDLLNISNLPMEKLAVLDQRIDGLRRQLLEALT